MKMGRKLKMSNIIDYVKWRGDLEMQIDPFNDSGLNSIKSYQVF